MSMSASLACRCRQLFIVVIPIPDFRRSFVHSTDLIWFDFDAIVACHLRPLFCQGRGVLGAALHCQI
ncbi:hypothetical protein LOK49_LG12G02283 [Camellia lanceoleosa]|uniref:Uncharacterized protein n=1 Tax=Camellia lanceoleosa TaxID=1840588 RepID=A0ACC0FTY2_9ERIC|nr:hypothetical protein LOK49_LG12G02283 [Camellia lanceoleosa]